MNKNILDDLSIISYQEQYKRDFKRLNYAWIEKFFKVERLDKRYLEYPNEEIILKGGDVLFALNNGKVVGTCALINTGEHVFELAKMAVDEAYRGRHIGKRLGQSAKKRARELGGKYLYLVSNSKLKPAIALYRTLGFEEIPIDTADKMTYSRCDIKMGISL